MSRYDLASPAPIVRPRRARDCAERLRASSWRLTAVRTSVRAGHCGPSGAKLGVLALFDDKPGNSARSYQDAAHKPGQERLDTSSIVLIITGTM
jgi:hypothetical protein